MIRISDLEDKKRLLILLSITFLILSLFYIFSIPMANGYEKSVYYGFPIMFWILFTLSIVFIVIYIFWSVMTSIKINYLILSAFILFISYFIFFLLPYIRGYALWGRSGADILVHVGYTKTILETNHIGVNWYPISHIFMAQFNMIGISFELSRILITFIFTIQYMIFTFFYFRELEKKIKSVPVLICVLPLIYSSFHVSFHPALMSFFVLPLILYVFEKTKKFSYIYKPYILLFLLLIFLVFFHPATTIMVILIFICYYLSLLFFKEDQYVGQKKSSYLVMISILFATFFIWYFQFSTMERVVKTRISSILFGAGSSTAERYSGQFVESELPLINRLIAFFEGWGSIVIYGSIALLFLLGFLRTYLSKKNITYSEFSIYFQYIAGIIFGGIALTTVLVGDAVERQGRWAIFFSTLIIGYGLAKKIKSTEELNDIKNKLRIYIVVFIIFLLIMSVLILSLSQVYHRNYQLTYSEKYGSNWYVDNANYFEKKSIESGLSYKMVYYLRGRHTSIERGDVFGSGEFKHPRRLGYEENETAAETFNQNVYIITKPSDYTRHEKYHPVVLEYIDYYLEEDLEKLENDPTVHKLYTNGEFIIWEVTST